MSSDEYRYKATCVDCGHEGVQVSRTDERGNTDDSWEGFDTVPASDYEFHRKRSDGPRPVCKCGSKNVVIGNTPLS